MCARNLSSLLLAIGVVVAVAFPTNATAAVEAVRGDDGALRITGSAAAEAIVVSRTEAGEVQVAVSGSTLASDDESCSVAADGATTTCAAASQVVVELGAGRDTVRIETGGSYSIVDGSGVDTIDLSAAGADAVSVAWAASSKRLVARCTGCASPWTVRLPGRPGTIVTGRGDDVVDVRRWPVRGATTWQLGAGDDQFKGASSHRSIVRAGSGDDDLVSYAARDELRGENGVDNIADFGGTGDRLDGGSGYDVISSMDGRADHLDGGAGRDFCLTSHGRTPRDCDTGSTLHFEASSYFPTSSVAAVLGMLTIPM